MVKLPEQDSDDGKDKKAIIKDKKNSNLEHDVEDNLIQGLKSGYLAHYQDHMDDKEIEGSIKARNTISVEETFDPETLFFTADKIQGFLSNPEFLDNFDTYLTMHLLIAVSDIFEKENILIRKQFEEMLFVGDIHGNYNCLEKILEDFKARPENTGIIFLGDYVDRGAASIKVLNRLFLEKLIYPERIILLRGNHEDMNINKYYGLYEEIKDRFLYRDVDKVFYWYNEIFGLMPIASLINNEIIGMHGGLPKGLVDIGEFGGLKKRTLIKPPEDSKELDQYYQILWNRVAEEDYDFIVEDENLHPRIRFGQKAVKEFLDHNRIKKIIISHEFIEDGYRYLFHKQILQLFSSANHMGRNNTGAYLRIGETGREAIIELLP